MEFKNVILIVADSLCYDDNLEDNLTFLSKHSDYTYKFNQYFTEAPFTEAAIIPLITSSRVLDYEGYLYNLADRERNINTTFKQLGYTTFNSLYFYPNTFPFFKDVDNYVYSDAVSVFSHISDFRLKYYRNKYKNNELSNEHKTQLLKLFESFFKTSTKYFKDFDSNHTSTRLITQYVKINEYNDSVREEYFKIKTDYENDKELFLEKLLKGNYSIFTSTDIDVIKSKEFYELSDELNSFIRKRFVKNVFRAIKYNKENRSLSVLKYMLNNQEGKLNTLKEWLVRINNYGKDYSYNRLSAEVMLNDHFDYLKKIKGDLNFSYIHINENHNPFNFLSYETGSVYEDFKDISSKENRDKTFYEYTKVYLNNQLKKYIDKIENELGLEDTLIILTADHGSSNTSTVYRDVNVMNFQDELFHIPLFMISKKLQRREIENYGSSSQFTSTLLDVMGIEDDFVESESILKNNKEYVIFEYFGPGTPDFTERNKLMCVRGRKYKIEYEVYVSNEYKITAIYDLVKDPKEIKNIINDETIFNNKEIQKMNVYLENRLKKLLI